MALSWPIPPRCDQGRDPADETPGPSRRGRAHRPAGFRPARAWRGDHSDDHSSPQQLGIIDVDAWRTGDGDRLGSILAESGSFRGPLGERDGREACVEGLLGMRALMTGLSLTTMLADDQDVLTWYDLQTAHGDLPTVNGSHIEDGLTSRIRATFDPRPILEVLVLHPSRPEAAGVVALRGRKERPPLIAPPSGTGPLLRCSTSGPE